MNAKLSVGNRRYRRIELPQGMLVAWHGGGQKGVSRIRTLGLGGIFISTLHPPPVGTLLKLIFDVPGGEVRARAVVRSIQPGKGMGLQFTAMAYEDRARLNQLLKRLLR